MERKELFKFLKERGYIYQTTNEEAIEKLITGEPITIYQGVDPTADSLHIGHCFPLIVLRYFQEAGHKIVILLGGATAMIGDPTGKRDMRKMVTNDFINSNLASIKNIIGKFLKLDGDNPVRFVNNYDWFVNQNYVEFMRNIGVHFNVNKMIATDAYKTRMEEGGLTFFEMGYMLMQAYDFVYLNKEYGCQIEMGGSDQWANIVAGVDLERKLALAQNKESKNLQAFTVPLLLNAEGKKMGKTEKGAVWVLKDKTSPYDFYQYFYNQSDESVEHLFKVLTDLPLNEIDKILKGDIREAKHKMAYEITKFVHGEQDAIDAQNTAKNLFNGDSLTVNAPTYQLQKSLVENGILAIDLAVLCGLCTSKGEARRLIEQNGLTINGEKVENLTKMLTINEFNNGDALLKKGKKSFIRVELV